MADLRNPNTLGALSGWWLAVRCGCGRVAQLEVDALARRYGPGAGIEPITTRLRCTRCGQAPRDFALTPPRAPPRPERSAGFVPRALGIDLVTTEGREVSIGVSRADRLAAPDLSIACGIWRFALPPDDARRLGVFVWEW
jgi:hypothetical protein